MKAQVYHNCVRVNTPCGGVLQFKRLGDLSVASEGKALRPVKNKWKTKARKAALDELSQELWGAR